MFQRLAAKSRFLGTGGLVIAAVAVLPSAFAHADPVAQSPSSTVSIVASDATDQGGAGTALQEIVVTAQKRSQRLNDVGISIVAATGSELQASGVTEVTQLVKIAPGFSVGSNYQGYPVFSLRGVNFNAAQFSAAPAVSTYIDEAILPYSPMTAGLLLDVDHVEVLKGPQGTLFGQNSTGGSINVISAKPTSSFKAGFDSEVDNFGRTMVEGYLSGPISDTLRYRLAAQTTQFGGYQKGYDLNDRKNGEQNKSAARLLLDWQPTDRLKVGVNVNGNYDHGEALQFQVGAVKPVSAAGAAPGLIGYPIPNNPRDADIPAGFDTHVDNRLYQSVVRIDYMINDTLSVTSLTNYVDFKSFLPQNITGVAIPIEYTQSTGNDQTFSQEIHLAGTAFDNELKYIIGGNYERDKIKDEEYLYSVAYSGLPPNSLLDTVYHPSNKQSAVFANADFEIVPRLSVTGGLRYTSITESTVGCTLANAPAAGVLGFIGNTLRGINGLPPTDAYVAGACATVNDNVATASGGPDYLPIGNDVSQKEHNVSWRTGLNYKITADSLVYAAVSRGFKAGVFPVEPDILHSGFEPVKQEELTSYEVGAKLDLLDHSLRLNVAAFYYDYRDKQFFTYVLAPPIGVTSTVVNVPKSSVKGIEIDATAMPVRNLTIRGAATYVDTKVGQYATRNSAGNLEDITGSEFNYAPPLSATGDAEYRMPVGADLHAYIGGDGLYNSHTYGDLGENPNQRIPDYFVLDARIGIASDKGWHVGLFGRNLADRYYWTGVFYAGDTIARVPGAPRTFGVSGGYNFQ